MAWSITKILRRLWFLPGLLLVLPLVGCSRSGGILSKDYPVGTVWQVPVNERGEADWFSASSIASEQHTGYTLASDSLEAIDLQDSVAGEGNLRDEVQVAIRNMVEEEEVVAVVGATTNQGSMRVASLVNFFSVPMLVPSANGDGLIASSNLWTFRLSAPGEAYADYLFGSVLTKANTEVEISEEVTVPLRIAILYEQNTFGESAAVATARAAMAQEMEIMVYGNFHPDTPDPGRMINLMNQVMENDVQLAYLITSRPAVAGTLVQIFHNRFQPETMPVLVGQAGGFASQEFLGSSSTDGIYIMRQQVLPDRCPEEIDSLYEAQTYAAVYLLEQSIQQAKENQPVQKISIFSRDQRAELAAFREGIRDILKASNLNIPCLGQVAFDNSGQNKLLHLELVTAQAGQVTSIPLDEFVSAVKQRSTLDTSQ